MKGGKQGRKRKSGGAAEPAQEAKRNTRSGAGRPAGAAPKKGSRKKSFGATTADDEPAPDAPLRRK